MIEDESPRMSAAGLTAAMVRAVQKRTPLSGDHRTAIPELTLHRRNKPTQVVHCVYTVGMAVTLQGGKHVLLGDKPLSYGPGQSLLTAIDLPVSYHITRATTEEPYLGVMLKFDQSILMQIASTLERPKASRTTLEPLSVQRLDAPVLDALLRLVTLLDEPLLLTQIAPLIQREILVRLLSGLHGAQLWNLLHAAGPTHQIAHAVHWIRQHFADEMRVEELAEAAHMSPTTFRQYFRSVTGMSPVQFQKVLRLQEARQIMLDQNMSAGGASALVGYESASQFSREYRRLFGSPPQADIKRVMS